MLSLDCFFDLYAGSSELFLSFFEQCCEFLTVFFQFLVLIQCFLLCLGLIVDKFALFECGCFLGPVEFLLEVSELSLVLSLEQSQPQFILFMFFEHFQLLFL